jgi:C-terminal processing protease CtpA/Prc
MKRYLWITTLFIMIGLLFAACASQPEPVMETEEPDANNPMSAIQTLSASTTIVPPTPVGGVVVKGPDDYVGLIRQAWSIVKAEYVWGNFNGADWPAIYDEYVALAENVTSSEELWDLQTELIQELDDDHSRFVPPDRMGAEYGIETSDDPEPRPTTGIVIWPGPGREDEYLTIWDVCELSSAASAGITRGDIILAIDGIPVEKVDDEFSRDDRSASIFGTGGDSVRLTVWQGPDQDPVDINLPLSGVGNCPYRYFYVVNEDPRIAYIRVPDFDGDTEAYLLKTLAELEEEGVLDGLILDVRHNPGGNSDASTEVFAEGIVGTVGPYREDKQRTIYRMRGPVGWNDTTPMVVVTDGASHSAADYFPASLMELDRATIVGMNSAGNTDGHTGFILADGTLIRLAVTSLALNDGTNLEGIGVTPDVIIPLGTWGLKAKPYDTQIQGAIDTLLDMIGH